MYIHKVLTSLLVFGATFCSAEIFVVNGTDSSVTRYPFVASLRFSNSHGCGCSILTSTWVLTAAHCVKDTSANIMSVQYGVTKISSSGPNIIRVKRFVAHPKYDRKNGYVNDIAVVELSKKIAFNGKTIAPVRLPRQNFEVPQNSNGIYGTIIGWGLDRTNGTIQTTLQEASINILSKEECNIGRGYKIKDTQICGDDIGRGQCNGDSGGPLLFRSKNGLVVVGLSSWSYKPCVTANGVYTKVSKYFNWIKNTINKIS